MAKRKPQEAVPQEQEQMMPGNDLEAMQNDIAQKEAFLASAQKLNEQNKVTEQEFINKSHDTEFTSFGEGVSEQPTLGVIGKEEVEEAFNILMKYKEEKANIERKIAENEEFWKMNHWDVMQGQGQESADKRVKPKSGWLFNTIINKHADAMDNYPEANILPRAKDDEETAKVLSKVVPVILEQNEYEKTYSDTQWYKAKNGVSVQGVFWDNDKNNGLGDIDIKKIDILSIFWKGGITNIQDSPNVFHVTMMDNDEIKDRYPNLNAPANSGVLGLNITETYQQGVDTSNQSAVIDWYYKKRVQITDELGIPKTNTVLHYCKFCNGEVIYASENDPNFADRGWYDHGQYPFAFDVLYPMEGTVCGMGYIDLIKDDQLYIDKLQQAILENAITNARPRYFIRSDGSVNEKEFLDVSKPIVHTEGNLGEDSIRAIEKSQLNDIYVSVYNSKISEMKDTSGNTASSQGQVSSVTTASGIASLQEAAGKLSRDANAGSYRAYKIVVDMVIELIRQFYNEPRCFRISGEFGHNEFVEFDNSGLQPQSQGQAFGIDLGNRLPIMDIDVRPQKKSAYSKESQNQTALNLYNLGFFSPNNADASLACLEMMDFDNIETVKEKVQNNGTLLQMVQQLQQQLQQYQQMMMGMGQIMGSPATVEAVGEDAAQTQAMAEHASNIGAGGKKGSIETGRGSLSSQAASATRGSTAPR